MRGVRDKITGFSTPYSPQRCSHGSVSLFSTSLYFPHRSLSYSSLPRSSHGGGGSQQHINGRNSGAPPPGRSNSTSLAAASPSSSSSAVSAPHMWFSHRVNTINMCGLNLL